MSGATLHDVAARAGLSPMTASRALGGRPGVSEASRERILAAAAELGYVPNAVARSLRSARSGLVSLIVSDIGNAFFAQLAATIERTLDTAGYRLMISSSDEDPAKEADLLRGTAQMRADGLIVVPTPGGGTALDRIAAGGVPVVQLDRAAPGARVPAVLLDNAGAARRAVHHLADNGYRRIAMITGPRELTTGSERVAGAERGAEESGASLIVVEAGSFMHEPSVAAAREAIALRPDAILAGNNITLEACADAFSREGVRIPDDIALVGFDDMPWMRWANPPITAVVQPLQQMARAAVDALLAQLDGSACPATRSFEAALVERASSTPRGR